MWPCPRMPTRSELDLNAQIIYSGRTVTARKGGVSRPIRKLIESQWFAPQYSLFDYGCGRAIDVRWLQERGYDAAGWDPEHHPHAPVLKADIVTLLFILNVIPNPEERAQALINSYNLSTQILMIAVRQGKLSDNREPYSDGYYIRARQTFQKIYDHDELRAYVALTLNIPDRYLHTVERGMLLVFKNPRLLESHFTRYKG